MDETVPSTTTLFLALLLAEAVFGLVFWLAWIAALVALLVVGAWVTAVLCAVLAVEAERAAVRFITGWTPTRLRLALTGLPVAVAVYAVERRVGWDAYPSLLAGIAPALLAQAFALRYLAGADTENPR